MKTSPFTKAQTVVILKEVEAEATMVEGSRLSNFGLVQLLVAILFLGMCSMVKAVTPRDWAVDLQTTTSATPPYLTLTWTQRMQSNIVSQAIYRRPKNGDLWVLQANLTPTTTSYADPTALPGVEYEYMMDRELTNIYPNRALGCILAGVNVPAIEDRGTLLLVIDDTMIAPLSEEIAQLKEDLVGDGWNVVTITAPRTATPPTVRSLIQAAYAADPTHVQAVYLLGHVPVPYSGEQAPDGHADHVGAWPADTYYGDIDGVWTDTTVNIATASDPKNWNVPGDGKFDQNVNPSKLELEVGRVDLSSMTEAPNASVSEVTLLRRYLNKAHAFRLKLGPYASIPRRSIICDNFGYFDSSEPFAEGGWEAALTAVGSDIDVAASGQWYNMATANTYLYGYGCGGGTEQGAGGVGSTGDFGTLPSHVVFTGMFGSYHGDWDKPNNYLRSILAGNATGDSLGLASVWSGRPSWLLHQCGLGETLGFAALRTQNSSGSDFNQSYPLINGNGIYMALMGDPALRFYTVEPPRNLAARGSGGSVQLKWDASTESNFLGYYVYRANTPDGPFVPLTQAPVTATTFTDTPPAGQTCTYEIRALKLESTPGGTYQNISQGSFVTLSGDTSGPFSPSGLTVTSGTPPVLTWTDNSSDETGFRIERKTDGGAFVTIGTVGANVTTFTDTGTLVNGSDYTYRVIATNGAGDSSASGHASVQGQAGFLEVQDTLIKVNRNAGSVNIVANRWGGATGAVSVTGKTSNVSAIAGTQYVAFIKPINFPNGVVTAQATVTLLNTGQPQLPREFHLTLQSPTNGASVQGPSATSVLIEDPTATLPAPWSQTLLGTVQDSSPAVFAEGAFGSAVLNGHPATLEGRYIYQTWTGDGVMTAYLDAPLPTTGQFGLSQTGIIVRSGSDINAVMAGALVAGNTTGANLVTRATAGAALSFLPGTNNSLHAPCWLRLTRSGNTFTAERSTDGITYTLLGSQSVSLPLTASWGLFHAYSNGSSEFQLARFSSVTLVAPNGVATPAGLAATPGNGQVALSWNSSSGATSYNVKRSTTSGGPYTTIAGPTTTTYTDTSVTNGTTYYYVVSGAANGNESSNSAEVSALPIGSVVTPTGLTATPGNGQVALGWNASPGATSYNVKRATTHGGPYTTIASPTTAGYVDTGVTNGTTYYYVVSASNGSESPNSSEVSAQPTGGGLPLPWSQKDFGTVAGGGASYASGTFTVNGGGAAIGGTADSFHFVYQPVTGDCTITAREVTEVGYHHSHDGVMIRASLATNAAYADTYISQSSSGYYYGVRATTGASGTNTFSTAGAAPKWLRVTRAGNTFTHSISSDGVTWTTIATSTVTMGSTVYVGMTQCDGNNGAGTSTYDNVTVATATLAAPGGVSATAGNAQVLLSWTASSGATSYKVKRATTSGGPYTTVGSPTTVGYTDTTVTNGTTYYYVVSAVNGSGESGNSGEVNATPQPPAPAAPTGASATPGNAQVALSWTASSGATSYKVKRATTSGGPYTTVGNPTTVGYTDTTATNGTTYYYVVSALNSGGESGNSGEVNAAPQPPAPAAPTGASATSGNAQTTLSWAASSGATSYNVKRSTTSGGPYTTVGSPTTTGYTDTTATNGTTYYYVVTAVNAGGESNISSEISATPQVPAPATPTGVGATSGNAQTTLSWAASSGATSYNVKRSTTSGGPYTTVGSPTTTGYTDTTATNGTTYYYVVTAVNAGGESNISSEVSATPQVPAPAAPTGLSATNGNAQALLSWTASSGATSYNVKRSATSGGPYTTIASPTTAGYTDTTVTNNTTYYYVVSAVNAGGESPISSQVSATPNVGGLPSPWLQQDIGTVASGGASYAGGTFTVNGGGTTIGGTTDSFHFVYQSVTGDCTITAREVTEVGNHHSYDGVMIRESLARNSTYADTIIKQSSAGYYYGARITAGASGTNTFSTAGTVPKWLRVKRVGNTFTHAISSDGVTWTMIATSTVTMGSTVYVGLTQCDGNNGAGTSTYDNVSVTTP